MNNFLEILNDLKEIHIDSKIVILAIVSLLLLYILIGVLVNIICKKRYNKFSIGAFVPIYQYYEAGLYSFNGYVGVILVFMPFFAFISSYYFTIDVCRILYVFCAFFYIICFFKLIIIAYNLSLNKETIDENGLIPNDFVITITEDKYSGEEVIKIKDLNDT